MLKLVKIKSVSDGATLLRNCPRQFLLFIILNSNNMRKIIIIGFLLITAAFTHPKSVKVMTTPAQLLENSLLVIWNSRNANQRLEEMKKTYAPDVHFYEFNTGNAIVGYTAINEVISKLQSEWPPESKFELNKPVQVNHSVQIASWKLAPEGKQPVATGTDVA